MLWIHHKQTCGSVRSVYRHRRDWQRLGRKLPRQCTSTFMVRRWPQGCFRDCQRQGGRRARRGDTLNTCELPQASSSVNEPKALSGSDQNGTQSGCWSSVCQHTDLTTAGVVGRGYPTSASAVSNGKYCASRTTKTDRLTRRQHSALKSFLGRLIRSKRETVAA